MIEWMPRSRGDNGWSHAAGSRYRGRAVLDDAGAGPVVRVPVVVEDWLRAALRAAGARVVRLARLAFFCAVFMSWGAQATARAVGRAWPVWAVVAGIVVLGFAIATYRLVRLRRWPSPGRRADLLVDRAGVRVGDLLVPWYQVERVVRFHFAAPSGRRRTRNFLALEVRDYVGVQGLTPVRAGLANLTRRHLVVLAETGELSHPEELAAALDELVANPVARELLSSAEGPRLLDEGPAWVGRRSP